MRHVLLIRLLCLVVAIEFFATPAWAYKRENRIPLVGCRGYFAASGAARYFAIRNVPKEKDREEILIEIHNVPLKPGTVLVVYIGEEAVGKITLDAKQSGSLKRISDDRVAIQPIEPGATVFIKTVDGRLVMW